MRHILEVLSKFNTGVDSNDYSLACIATSNPVYLVFSTDKKYPLYAIRKLCTVSLDAEFHTLSSIYDLVGRLTPKPLGSVSHLGNDYIIQEGVEGRPWFRVTERYGSERLWSNLKDEIRKALGAFEDGLCKNEGYIHKVNLKNQLDAYFDEFKENNSSDDEMNTMGELYRCYREHFSRLDDVYINAQHGDFTLNNLLINHDGITIIDFEDFNFFKVPFYDNFSMALSMVLHAPKGIDSDFNREIHFFTSMSNQEGKYSKESMQGFFFMSLIAQLGGWSLGEKRAKHRLWLKGVLTDFANHPERYIS